MKYSLKFLANLVHSNWDSSAKDIDIEHFLYDSRSLTYPKSTLFFAIESQRNDGHKYIVDLYQQGVRAFVVEKLFKDTISSCPGAIFLHVVDSLAALQKIATYHRKQYQIPIVGITGSNGKTIVKEWLFQLIGNVKKVTRSPRSFNSQIGVPLSLCLIDSNTEVALIEAGISEDGEMKALEKMIKPTIGVITNIGSAHQENFYSIEEKCAEKLRLFRNSDVLVYNADDPIISKCIRALGFTGDLLGWSKLDSDAIYYIRKIIKKETTTTLLITLLQKDYEFELPFTDDISIENIINCLGICFALHIPYKSVVNTVKTLSPIQIRLEVKRGNNNCWIINDSCRSDLNSLDLAIDFMNRRKIPEQTSKTLILSDVTESTLNENEQYQQIADLVNCNNINLFIGVGKKISSHEKLFKCKKYFYNTTEELIKSNLLERIKQSLILIKGEKSFQFEQIDELLSEQIHETILEINLNAIIENLNYYRSFMQKKTKLVCMVKANAYGSGSIEIARTLQDRGVEYIAVAVADEGVLLRNAGITTNIIVMNPEMSSFDTLFKYHLQPEIYSFKLLNAFSEAATKHNILNFPIHIKLDTGMHRLGFNPTTEIDALISTLKKSSSVCPHSIFSHFVGSDSSEFDAFSKHQFELFDEASRKIQKNFKHHILRHICNSAAIERFPYWHLDMCRLGLGLYGIDPINNKSISVVSSLYTTILQIRTINSGETIGYSRKGKVFRASKIAAIPIGYADGLNRHLGNGHCYCLVNGQKAYYIGNICMDVAMIDVTDIQCKEGDRVEIFGKNLPVQVLSNTLQTIPYEILTSIGQRVKRIYTQE